MEIPKIEIPKQELKIPTIKKVEFKSKDNEETRAIKKLLRENGYDIKSYSELSTFHNCKYEYYLSYIKRNRGKDNVYSRLGSIVHDVLESYIKGECTKQEMIDKFEYIYQDSKIPKIGATSILQFPSEKIEKNYIECIRIFLQNYEKPKADKVLLETFLFDIFGSTLALQGYADLILGYEDKNGKYAIIDDFKTSSKFKQSDLLEKGRQLVMYAYMYTKRTGIPVKMVRWQMVKYYEVSYPNILPQLKKKSVKELKEFLEQNGITEKFKKDEMIDRVLKFDLKGFIEPSDTIIYQKNELAIKIAPKVAELLIRYGISQDIVDRNINILNQTCSLNYLDDNIKDILNKLNVYAKDYFLEYHLTDEIYDEMENYLLTTYNEIKKLPKDVNGQEVDFYYPPIGNIKDDPFYCHNLCGHARDNNGNIICKHYKKYVDDFSK